MINGQASGDERATSGRYYTAFIQQKKAAPVDCFFFKLVA